MIAPADTLLKYDNPVLVSKYTEKNIPKVLPVKTGPPQTAISAPIPPPRKLKSPTTDAHEQQTEEILDAIIPPNVWTENNKLWVQRVSSMPSTRADVIHLQEELDLKLRQEQARDTGICPARRELYTQCFDELIRQITINCAERGMLLLKIRDEIRMTLAAHQTLYESSVAYGLRKALQAERDKEDMDKKIADLEIETRELQRQVDALNSQCEEIEIRENEQRMLEEEKYTEEIQALQQTNQHLKHQLPLEQARLFTYPGESAGRVGLSADECNDVELQGGSELQPPTWNSELSAPARSSVLSVLLPGALAAKKDI